MENIQFVEVEVTAMDGIKCKRYYPISQIAYIGEDQSVKMIDGTEGHVSKETLDAVWYCSAHSSRNIGFFGRN